MKMIIVAMALMIVGTNAALAQPKAISMKRDLAITLGGPDVHNKEAEDFCEAQCVKMVGQAAASRPDYDDFWNLTCEVRNVEKTVECVLTGIKKL